MEGPLISVILPVYNVEDYLDQCMSFVLGQTYRNLEIILVDDGSTDSSPALCDTYADKYPNVSVYHKANGGLSDARNYGFEHSTGDYITFIDPDDYPDRDMVEYLYTVLKKYGTRMSLCTHRVVYKSGDQKDYGSTGDEVIFAHDCIEKMMYHETIDTSAWAKLYERSLFSQEIFVNEGFIRYPRGHVFEDIATTYKFMIASESIACGYESKYNYIYRGNSIVNRAFSLPKLDLLYMTDDCARHVVAQFPDLEEATLRRRVYARISTLNQMMFATGCEDERQEILDFIKANKDAVLANPRTPKRDKWALNLLAVSYEVYKTSWQLYRKFR